MKRFWINRIFFLFHQGRLDTKSSSTTDISSMLSISLYFAYNSYHVAMALLERLEETYMWIKSAKTTSELWRTAEGKTLKELENL